MQDLLKKEKIAAMKGKDKVASSILGMLHSDAKNFAINDGQRDITDEDFIKAAKSLIKRNQQALELNADQPDLLHQNEVLEKFLPQMFSEDQLKSMIQEIVDTIPADQRGPAAMGKIMGQLKQHGEAVDMGMASRLVKESLA